MLTFDQALRIFGAPHCEKDSRGRWTCRSQVRVFVFTGYGSTKEEARAEWDAEMRAFVESENKLPDQPRMARLRGMSAAPYPQQKLRRMAANEHIGFLLSRGVDPSAVAVIHNIPTREVRTRMVERRLLKGRESRDLVRLAELLHCAASGVDEPPA